MQTIFPINSLAASICHLLGISTSLKRNGNALLPFDYTKKPDRLCLITVDSLGLSLINSENTPFINGKFEKKKLVLESEKPCFTAVNFVSMASGMKYNEHKISKKNQEIHCDTFLDIMKKCALKTCLISYKNSTLLNLFAQKAKTIKENYMPQDKYTADLIFEELNRREYDFIWGHFMDLDKTGHRSGPQSEDTKKVIKDIDSNLKEIALLCKKNNYMLIINSDHGQHTTEKGYGIHDGSHENDVYVPLIVI
jgi:Uncharacterized proteins of the AP superfamily